MVRSEKIKGWQHITSNVERLISDANLLQHNGRYASALSTAILAFEEAGKGSNFETDFGISRKGKFNAYSWHMLRQIVSGFFLSASLLQKYGITPSLSKDTENAIRGRWDGFQNMKDVASAPIPEEVREKVLKDLRGNENLTEQIEKLGEEDRFIYAVEQRWTRKLFVASMSGKTEILRQQGMYVDLNGDAIESTPASIDGIASQYWINAAERALLIFRDGNYKAPYGPLATYLESLEKPFDPMVKAQNFDAQIKWLKKGSR